jgi:hypothetical protein
MNPNISGDEVKAVGSDDKPSKLPPGVSSQVPELFSSRRPKHAGAGILSGFKNFGKGVAAGVAAFVAAPVIGAKEEGLKGFGKGLAAGTVGLVALPVAGVVTGVVQMGRGLWNTGEAVHHGITDDKDWDPEKRCWYTYNLKVEADTILSMSEEELLKKVAQLKRGDGINGDETSGDSAENSSMFTRDVKDMGYYDLLGVPNNATASDIKKGYFKQARKYHPDKNVGDADATARFQQIGKAYQVLSDDELRAAYDQGGEEGVEGAPQFDSSTFYEMVFGSEKFEPFVGELQLTSTILDMQKHENGKSKDRTEDQENALSKFKQTKRVVSCALNLVDLLDKFLLYTNCGLAGDVKVRRSSQEYKKAMVTAEAEYEKYVREGVANELSATEFGKTLLAVIGYVYSAQAEHTMSNVAVQAFGSFSRKAHRANNYIKLASAGVSMMSAVSKEDQEAMEDGTVSPEKQATLAQKHSAMMLEVMYNAAVIDIEDTLEKVCWKAMHDRSVDKAQRKRRAQALKIVGHVFQSYGGNRTDGMAEFANKLQMMQGEADPTGASGDQAFTEFTIGMRVSLHSLKTEAINGKTAVVEGPYNPELERVPCKLEDDGRIIALKPINLTKLS